MQGATTRYTPNHKYTTHSAKNITTDPLSRQQDRHSDRRQSDKQRLVCAFSGHTLPLRDILKLSLFVYTCRVNRFRVCLSFCARVGKITTSSCTSFTESYERRDKPSVLVTSPGSPDLHSTNRCSVGGTPSNRYTNRLVPAVSTGTGSGPTYDPNIGGRIQVKLGFESSSLQLIVTLVCAAGLTIRSNGGLRNPYGKVRNFGRFLSQSIDTL